MGRRTASGVAVAIAAAVLAGCGSGGSAEDEDTYVLGWINPLSGPAASFGEASRQGVELAVEDIEAEEVLGDTTLKVIYEDNEFRPEASVPAFEKIIGEDPAAVMSAGSSVVLALSPLAEQAGVPLANVGAQSSVLTTDEHPGVYSFIPMSSAEAVELADRVLAEDLSEAAVLRVDADYGSDTADAFVEAFEKGGGTVVAQEKHDAGATDMRAQLSKIRGQDPEALVIVSNASEVGHAVAQAEELGLDAERFGFTYALSGENFDIAQEAMDGMRGTAVTFNPSTAEGKDFAERFEEKFGAAPNAFSAISYDATRILAAGLAEVGNDPAALADHVAQVEDHPGVLGATTMSQDREAQFPLTAWAIAGGEIGPWS